MPQISVKLEGADKLATKLKAYLLFAPKRVQNVVASTLLEIEADAKDLAPVDSGLLRSSIHANFKGAFAGSISVNVDYASYVEFGTSKRRAQPYLTPAFQKNKAAFLANLKEALKFKI
jgi:HK97 gp10 family phage protein